MSVGSGHPETVFLSDAKYFSLHPGNHDFFSINHHFDSNRVRITVHRCSDPQEVAATANLTPEGSSLDGDLSVWSYVQKNYVSYYAGPHWKDSCLLQVAQQASRLEAHVRSSHGLADRFRIADIILIRFHIRLDKLWRHQPYRVPEALQRTAPVMSTGARLQANEARRQIGKEYRHLLAPQLLAQHRSTPFINSMHLKYVFRQINTDSCNLHGGRSHPFKW
jgi:hypothetical protein